jgi:TPR repeat protein
MSGRLPVSGGGDQDLEPWDGMEAQADYPDEDPYWPEEEPLPSAGCSPCPDCPPCPAYPAQDSPPPDLAHDARTVYTPEAYRPGPYREGPAAANSIGGSAPAANAPAPAGRSWKGKAIPAAEKIQGEDEFLRGSFLVAAGPLTAAFRRGDLRGAFYSRIIYENGLDGRAPDFAAAGRAMDVLALRYPDIRVLARRAPENLRPLYKTALGLLHMRGRVPSGERDLSRAADLLEDAADEGFTPAMNILAAAGCDPDPPQHLWGLTGTGPSDCFKWTREAALRGDSVAMANLSGLYRTGTGTLRDPLRAVEWAHRAATKSPPSARSQNDMGAFHLIGEAVSRDTREARRWFNMAKARYPLAKDNLAGAGKSGFVPVMARNIDY